MSYSTVKASKYDVLVKLLLIGDTGVGKSCLLLRFAEDSFTPSFITTIGIDFKIKLTNIHDKRVKLQIWDTAGQERFRTITTAYYRGAMGIILVYDVTDEDSFTSISNWMHQIQIHASENVNMLLIGNKCDASNRRITYQQGSDLATSFNMKFFETSARDNLHVTDSFMSITSDVMDRMRAFPAQFESDSVPVSLSQHAALSSQPNLKPSGVETSPKEVNSSSSSSCC